MINLNQEFEQILKCYSISDDKKSLQWIRDKVRSFWGDSPMKTQYMKSHTIEVENTNPKSMKRFPVVKKVQCAKCQGWFGQANVELDHINGEHSLLKFDDIESFFKAIIFPKPDEIQILCKDKRNSKKELIHLGCHGVKTYSERYGVSLKHARIIKFSLEILKQKQEIVFKRYIPTLKVSKAKMVSNLKGFLLKFDCPENIQTVQEYIDFVLKEADNNKTLQIEE